MRIRGDATWLALLVLSLSGCGTDDQAAQAPATAADAGAEQTAEMPRQPSPPDASVYFVEPEDGASVQSPVTVKFGIEGMQVAPAGDPTPNSGHHHLLIDTELADPSLPVPSDDQHLHFGKGQTETVLELPPGEHRLQLVLGDANHVPHDPPVMSEPITITVEN